MHASLRWHSQPASIRASAVGRDGASGPPRRGNCQPRARPNDRYAGPRIDLGRSLPPCYPRGAGRGDPCAARASDQRSDRRVVAPMRRRLPPLSAHPPYTLLRQARPAQRLGQHREPRLVGGIARYQRTDSETGLKFEQAPGARRCRSVTPERRQGSRLKDRRNTEPRVRLRGATGGSRRLLEPAGEEIRIGRDRHRAGRSGDRTG